MSTFRDESWDFTAFVRTLALYVDARLEASVGGKLLRRCTVSSLGAAVVVERIGEWQKLLGRAMGTRPTGQARGSRLVRIVFYAVMKESFELYRDIVEGISFLHDGFFGMPVELWGRIVEVSRVAARQFEELEGFYAGCKKLGIGRQAEYPSVMRVSDAMVETLEGFLKEGESARMRSELLPPPEEAKELVVSLDSESWEVALLESVNELSVKCGGEGEGEGKKAANFLGYRNPFMRAANDRGLMAVGGSSSSGLGGVEVKKDGRLMRIGCWENGEEEGDAFDELARRERPAVMVEAARGFREQYHRQKVQETLNPKKT